METMTPTPYPDLNALLADLVGGATDVLGQNFFAAYLQGSFALGTGDEHSDVDFIVVTCVELSDRETNGLQELHRHLFAEETPWAQHLEGSYAPREILAAVDPERRPFLFLDNGAQELEPDNHCNSAVVRWVLREHGVVLAGPEPNSFIAPPSRDDLRKEGFDALAEYAVWATAPTKAGGMSEWKQIFLVLAFCRILCMLDTGDVVSKRRGAEWALQTLDPRWHRLIEQSLADRADPWGRVHRPTSQAKKAEALAFVSYVMDELVPEPAVR